MPIKMIYKPSATEKGREVLVFHFQYLPDFSEDGNYQCVATFYDTKEKIWYSCPIYDLVPLKESILNE